MPATKKTSLSSKKFTFPLQEEFERVVKRAQKSNKKTNFLLMPDATELDKAKYELCKNILRYKHDQELSTKEIAQQLRLNIAKTETILYSRYQELTFDELFNYASNLHLPFEVKIHSSYDRQKASPEAR